VKELGGCDFLTRLCNAFEFQETEGHGKCLVEGKEDGVGRLPAPMAYSTQVVSPLCCQQACNAKFSCAGYTYEQLSEHVNWHGDYQLNGHCGLVSASDIPDTVKSRAESAASTSEQVLPPTLPPVATTAPAAEALTPTTPALASARRLKENAAEEEASDCGASLKFNHTQNDGWNPYAKLKIVGADNSANFRCFSKTLPKVVDETHKANRFASVISAISLALLVIGALTSCCFQYTLATRRRGKKGLCSMLPSMLCPCCVGSEPKRRNNKLRKSLESEQSSGSSDEENNGLFGRRSSRSRDSSRQ